MNQNLDQLWDDDGYREWAETIELQNLRFQIEEDFDRADSLITLSELNELIREDQDANEFQVIDLSSLGWEEFIRRLTPGK